MVSRCHIILLFQDSVYSDEANQWSVTGLDETATYIFRVRANNKFGWSNFSASSFPIELDRVLAQKGALKASLGKNY